MCGFVGIIHTDGSPVDPQILTTMTDVQKHRGPDDHGYCLVSFKTNEMLSFSDGTYINENKKFEVGVGFNRLSIIDVSHAGHQPMLNRTKSVQIVFNGEIYNAGSYKSELLRDGIEFRGHSDTEIILCLYEKYGFEGMLVRLNGMFSIAIIDLDKQTVFIARDRLGIKPLYLFRSRRCILFASEIKSFLYHPYFLPEINIENLDEYLLFRYLAGERTLFNGVEQVKPGCFLEIKDGKITHTKYWSIPPISHHSNFPLSEMTKLLEEKLTESVKLRLVSDVALGCQLSGGIDSSIINMLAKESSSSRLQAFSVVFDNPIYSEESWVEQAVAVAKVELNKYILEEDYFSANYEKACWHYDQPLNHPNSLGLFYLAENASKKVKVLLSGEGADELLGGYSRFFYNNLHDRYPAVYKLATVIQRLRRRPSTTFGDDDCGPALSFILASAFAENSDIKAAFPLFDLNNALQNRLAIFNEEEGSHLSKCLNYETKTYMVDLLLRQDKMTMAHSVENRVPYLDHHFVEAVRGLPESALVDFRLCFSKLIQQNTKIVLKKLAEKYFSQPFVYRRKSGFAIPFNVMLNSTSMREKVQEQVLPSIKDRGMFDYKTILKLWSQMPGLTSSQENILWMAISFEVWAQQFIDRKTSLVSAPATLAY